MLQHLKLLEVLHLVEIWHLALFKLLQSQDLIVLISVVVMDAAESELIKTTLPYDALPRQVHIAVFLDYIVLLRLLYLVTCLFDIGPASFHIECLVEGKLLVDHPEAVICPHVVKTVLR